MADHEELVREIPIVQQMSVEQRLEHARFRRGQQLAKWRIYEKEMNAKSYISHRAVRLRYEDDVMMLDATQRGDIDEVRNLLEQGISPDIPNHDGVTAMHQSSIDGTDDILRLLIKYGANVNCTDENGWTPLHVAVTCHRVSIIRILLDAGADILALNHDMTFPYDLIDNDPNVLAVLEDEMMKRGITVELMSQLRNLPEQRYLKMLQDGGLDASSLVLQKIDSTDATHLHFAAAYNFCQVARYLLEKGAAVDSLDKKHWTPLHVACHFARQDVAQILLEHDADPERMTDTGLTVYDVCESPEMKEWLMNFVLYLKKYDMQRRRSTLPVSPFVQPGDPMFLRGSPRRSSLRDGRRIRRNNDEFYLVVAAKNITHEETSAATVAEKPSSTISLENEVGNKANYLSVTTTNNNSNFAISEKEQQQPTHVIQPSEIELSVEDLPVYTNSTTNEKSPVNPSTLSPELTEMKNNNNSNTSANTTRQRNPKQRRGWFRCCSVL